MSSTKESGNLVTFDECPLITLDAHITYVGPNIVTAFEKALSGLF